MIIQLTLREKLLGVVKFGGSTNLFTGGKYLFPILRFIQKNLFAMRNHLIRTEMCDLAMTLEGEIKYG